MPDKHYEAFISYRHSELDMYVASRLQKRIENYKLPKSVRKKYKIKKVGRIFRDQTELNVASNLSEALNDALYESDNLLVICTPRLPESKWCMQEVDNFMANRGREKILLILAEGEPHEAFPPQLLTVTEEYTDENGEIHKIEKNIEPLAADVRGKTQKEINKKIDDAVLRASATILNISYDELKQRQHEQDTKDAFRIMALICSVFLAFALVTTGFMLRIQNQKNQITEQYEALETANDTIVYAYSQIDSQLKQMNANYVNASIKNAEQLYDSGKLEEARYLLNSVLPLTSESEYYTPEAERVLNKCNQNYIPYKKMNLVETKEVMSKVKSVIMSEYSNHFIILENNYVELFEIGEDNTKIIASFYFSDDKEIKFISSDELWFFNEGNHLTSYSINDDSFTEVQLDENAINFYPDDFGNTLIVEEKDALKILTVQNGTEIATVDLQKESIFDNVIFVDYVGINKAVMIIDMDKSNEWVLRKFNTDNGQIEFEKTFKHSKNDYLDLHMITKDYMYFTVNTNDDDIQWFDYETIYKVNLSDGKIEKSAKIDKYMHNISIYGRSTYGNQSESGFLLLWDESNLMMMDADTLEIIDDSIFEAEISFVDGSSNILQVYLVNGTLYEMKRPLTFYYNEPFNMFPAGFGDIYKLGEYKTAVVSRQDCRLYIYEQNGNKDKVISNKSYVAAILNTAGDRIIIREAKDNGGYIISLLDSKTYDEIKNMSVESYEQVAFVDNGNHFCVFENESIKVFDSNKGTLIQEWKEEGKNNSNVLSINETSEYILFRKDYKDVVAFNVIDGSEKVVLSDTDNRIIGDKFAYSSDLKYICRWVSKSNQLSMYEGDSNVPSAVINDDKLMWVKEIRFSEDDEYISVAYTDGLLEIYDINLNLKFNSYYEYLSTVSEMKWNSEYNAYFLVIRTNTKEECIILNSSFECIATIDCVCGVSDDLTMLMMYDGFYQTVQFVKYEENRKILAEKIADYQMSEDRKSKLGIDSNFKPE